MESIPIIKNVSWYRLICQKNSSIESIAFSSSNHYATSYEIAIHVTFLSNFRWRQFEVAKGTLRVFICH